MDRNFYLLKLKGLTDKESNGETLTENELKQKKVIQGILAKMIEDEKKSHKYWDQQPMMSTSYTENKIKDTTTSTANADEVEQMTSSLQILSLKDENYVGPIEMKQVSDVRQEPEYLDPELNLRWCSLDLLSNETNLEASTSASGSSSTTLSTVGSGSKSSTIDEVYHLLATHYVEDNDNMFRFNYSHDFLMWALTSPGSCPELIVGLRSTVDSSTDSTVKEGTLMGLITGVPIHINSYGKEVPMVEINFLCVHKSLREKRLAPTLISEITRRTNLKNIWQAVYTAGVQIPTPSAKCRYYHRQINSKKAIEVNFSRLPKGSTLSKAIKKYKVEEVQGEFRKMNLKIEKETYELNFRPMERKDVPQVTQLLNRYLSKFKLFMIFTEEEVIHWLLPRPKVIASFVIEKKTKESYIKQYKKLHRGTMPPDVEFYSEITDFCSYYHLPSAVLNNEKHDNLYVVYSFYNVPSTVSMELLFKWLLHEAKNDGADVMNVLNLMENEDELLRSLLFGPGDGFLHYYLYNWKSKFIEEPKDVGMVLL